MKKTQMMTVSKRAILGRVNCRLEKDCWHRVKVYRGRLQFSEGNWFEIDIRRNAVIAQHLNLEARASLASWPIMKKWKVDRGPRWSPYTTEGTRVILQ